MTPKFKIGDKVKVIKQGRGCRCLEIGKIVTIEKIGNYESEIGYVVNPKIGNSLTGGYKGFIGESSFELKQRKISLKKILKR